ncbi:phage tail protein [Pinibacter soli]|uniref:Phage tail protein n=1 Tax=Pinibacter soli TaxID=3044211 RepID=A0ABT6RBQ4_9BACT|nr:phage tail protein [Pinibacter soli]MDI3320000.1 phage tail protein [Pinibacter soli]
MGNVAMADSISYLPEFKSWYSVFKEELGQLDLSKLLVYIIETVDASALPYLAEQFDVLGYKGFRMAQTEADQREVLKRAIELHRYKGTEWAIKEGLKSIGFPDVELKKTGYDHWAKFGVKLTNSNVQLTANSFNDIIQMVAEYKRAVCVLMDVTIDLLFDDTIDLSDDDANALPAVSGDDNIEMTGTLKYDGEGMYDGDYDHSGDSDVVTITPI